MMYIRQDVIYTVLCKVVLDLEYWAILIKIRQNGRSVIIGTRYRSPHGNLSKFTDFLEDTLKQDFVNANETIIMGDVNVEYRSFAANRLKLLVIDCGFKQIVEQPTRVTNTSSTLIDWIITNNFILTELPRNFPNMSNHSFIGVEIKSCKMKHEKEFAYIRKFNNDKMNGIRHELLGKYWETTSTDVNVVYRNL